VRRNLVVQFRLRAAIAALPFEPPKLGVTAMISDDGSLPCDLIETMRLDRAVKRSEMKLIEAKPDKGLKAKTDLKLAPPIPDRRFRRV
jgi:hypothetical protein